MILNFNWRYKLHQQDGSDKEFDDSLVNDCKQPKGNMIRLKFTALKRYFIDTSQRDRFVSRMSRHRRIDNETLIKRELIYKLIHIKVLFPMIEKISVPNYRIGIKARNLLHKAENVY